jgi:hypothetical protein
MATGRPQTGCGVMYFHKRELRNARCLARLVLWTPARNRAPASAPSGFRPAKGKRNMSSRWIGPGDSAGPSRKFSGELSGGFSGESSGRKTAPGAAGRPSAGASTNEITTCEAARSSCTDVPFPLKPGRCLRTSSRFRYFGGLPVLAGGSAGSTQSGLTI